MTGLLAHGVWLALILGHASVDLPVDIPSVSALVAISFVSGGRTGQCPIGSGP